MNITYQEAAQALNAAIAKAKTLGIPVSIAIVDQGGHQVAFARLDSVYGVIDFAIKKAKTAVMFGVDSDVMGTIIHAANGQNSGMIQANDGLLTLAGGVVLKNKAGIMIGAIGSSGGTPEQDKAIAAAGATAIQ
ncbi:GlcG/HbpS family heme-binding protein [Taibaiella chishuiensis]|uniref:Uncharacterized protein GlcG (DUF336 family) n=1 Tax=Taibaiella chishuiensis TaxID=1434707 RepID=A0A2P8D1Y9_9BACT|nr:heme-binding protein [Taibaiella chishuiensis]PSK91234.1 uncharacterized protein GlcG (DUF336 family) [Taibaiella chishuiensis]